MAANYFRILVFVAAGLMCTASYGEELPELITRLQTMEKADPVHVVVGIEDRTTETESKGQREFEKADLIITADANTLTLSVTGKIRESRIFKEFSLLRAKELVDYGPALAGKLAGLKLAERRSGTHKGKPCTRWLLKSEVKESKLGMSATRRQDVELLIDSEGYPLAASFKMRGVSKVLFMKLSHTSTCEQRYERLGGRLILAYDKEDETVRGKKSEGKRIVTTTVEAKKD